MRQLIWKPVSICPGYEISDEGDVRNITSGQLVVQYPVAEGYWSVRISKKNFRVHKLVLLAHVGPPPTPQHFGKHGPGGRGDNSVGNLRWATSTENESDRRFKRKVA